MRIRTFREVGVPDAQYVSVGLSNLADVSRTYVVVSVGHNQGPHLRTFRRSRPTGSHRSIVVRRKNRSYTTIRCLHSFCSLCKYQVTANTRIHRRICLVLLVLLLGSRDNRDFAFLTS